MTVEDFRRIALSLPEAVENSHMGHPDFRVRGKIFATLGYPDDSWGMVKLTPDQQESMVDAACAPDAMPAITGTAQINAGKMGQVDWRCRGPISG